MATFGDVISRGDAQPLMPEEFSNAILEKLEYDSAAMKFFRKIKMGRKQTRLPILAALPQAYFVNGDTGLINTTKSSWNNKYLNAEELAVIVPVPKSVLDDEEYDMWANMEDMCRQAIGRCLDNAVFFGVNKPATWGTAIWTGIQSYSAIRNQGVATIAQGGLGEDINTVLEFVETSGFVPNGLAASGTFKATLRRVRDTLGQKLLDVSTDTVEGVPVKYCMPGIWQNVVGQPAMIAGDFTEGMLGYRQDIGVEVLQEAVIQDSAGNIIFNLAQQNMIALKLICRFGYEISNTINWTQPDSTKRFPFAALVLETLESSGESGYDTTTEP